MLAPVLTGTAFGAVPVPAADDAAFLLRRFQMMQRARRFLACEPLADGFAGVDRAKLSDGQIVWRQRKEELHAHLC